MKQILILIQNAAKFSDNTQKEKKKEIALNFKLQSISKKCQNNFRKSYQFPNIMYTVDQM